MERVIHLAVVDDLPHRELAGGTEQRRDVGIHLAVAADRRHCGCARGCGDPDRLAHGEAITGCAREADDRPDRAGTLRANDAVARPGRARPARLVSVEVAALGERDRFRMQTTDATLE